MIATLRHRNFALVWLGGLISFTGDWMQLTALPFFVYQQTGSTLATAGITAASLVPPLVLGSIAGVFVDRWDRRRLLLVANLLQAAAILVLLVVRASDRIWLVFVVTAVEATLRSFTGPAENALLPRLVEPAELVSANALNRLNNTLARLLGPPLGGFVLGTLGLPAIVLINSGSFLVAAACFMGMSVDGRPGTNEREPESADASSRRAARWNGFWHEWRAGFALVGGDRLLLTLVGVLGLMTFGGTMMDPLYPPFVQDVLRAGPLGFGWIVAAHAWGGVVGGLVIGHLGSVLSATRLLVWGNLLVGGLLLIQFNVPVLAVTVSMAFLIGPEQAAAGSALQTLLQRRVRDAYQGRVFGALGTTGALLSLAGGGLGGVLGSAIGVVPTLNLAAGLTIGSGVLAWLLLPTEQHAAPASADIQD